MLVNTIIEDFSELSSLADYYKKSANKDHWRKNYKKKENQEVKPKQKSVIQEKEHKISEKKDNAYHSESTADQPNPPDNFPPDWDDNFSNVVQDQKIIASPPEVIEKPIINEKTSPEKNIIDLPKSEEIQPIHHFSQSAWKNSVFLQNRSGSIQICFLG